MSGLGFAEQLALASDISMRIGDDGVVLSVHSAEAEILEESEGWIGKPWVETVTVESRPKVEQLIRETLAGAAPQRREINQIAPKGEFVVRYAVVRLERGGLIALGQDLRAVARMQQRLVDAQRAMERDYLRLRGAETRYRLLFQLSSEAVMIVDAANGRIIDVNPSASALLETTPGRVVGRPFADFFDARDRELIQGVIVGARSAGRLEPVRAALAAGGRAALVAGVAYRQDEATHALMRLTPLDGTPVHGAVSPVADAVAELPDAMVVTDLDRVVRTVNRAYLDMVELARPDQALGENLERRLGRTGAEAGVLFGNLREHGAIRDFATVLRGELGAVEDVDVTAAAVRGGLPGYVFLIRRTAQRLSPPGSVSELPRTADELTELIGRLPLKDIVRETADVIERLCIEEALRLTNDNRAAAAQMLGVSRQSLYDKLRRYGLGDLGGDAESDDG